MVAPAFDPAVQELQRQVAELSSIVKSPTSISRYLDVNSKKIINDVVNDVLFDSIWDTLYQYSTEFESLSGFSVDAGVDLFGGGIRLSTSGANGDFQSVTKYTSPSKVFDSTKRSDFRAAVIVDQVTQQTGRILAGSSVDEGYGFSFTNAAISGVTYHTGVATSIALNTSFDAGLSVFLLEAKYYPGLKVDFFINGIQVGSLTKGLPSTSVFSGSIWTAVIQATEAVSKVMHIYAVEYIQKRK